MMFCNIVGQATRQTAAPMGPSTIDRSYLLGLTPALDTGSQCTTEEILSIFDRGSLICESLLIGDCRLLIYSRDSTSPLP
jgi:hypothetical protein